MGKSILVVRGGALPIESGLGRAHNSVTERIRTGLVSDWSLAGVIEHPLNDSQSSIKRLRKRWSIHPRHVASEISKICPSIVHITDQEQAHLVPDNPGCPVVVTIHDLFHLNPQILDTHWGQIEIGEKPGFIRRMDIRRLISGLQRADAALCISEATAAHVNRFLPDLRTFVVPNSVDLKSRDPRTKRLSSPNLEAESMHLLVVGSEDRRKALDFALEVIGALDVSIRRDILLHKVGAESSSVAEKRLKEKASTLGVRMRWHGRVEEEELIALEQNVEALLFPSAAEGFGLPVVEAMASGCPVLVNDLGAQNEHPPNRSILPAFDQNAWCVAIEDMHRKWVDRGMSVRPIDEEMIRSAEKRSPSTIGAIQASVYDQILR